MVGVDHVLKIAMHKGKGPVIASGVKDNSFTISNMIAASYFGKGWVGAYGDPGAYGGSDSRIRGGHCCFRKSPAMNRESSGRLSN